MLGYTNYSPFQVITLPQKYFAIARSGGNCARFFFVERLYFGASKVS